MATVAHKAHHSELLEVLPELRLAAVVRNAPHKDLVGFAAVAPGSFLLSRRRGSVTADGPRPTAGHHTALPVLLYVATAVLLPWALQCWGSRCKPSALPLVCLFLVLRQGLNTYNLLSRLG